MPAFSRPIRVYARHPLVKAFITAWNAAQAAPLYLAGPGYGYGPTDVVENMGPWDRMESALTELLDDPAARLEALYLDLDRRTGMRFDQPAPKPEGGDREEKRVAHKSGYPDI